MHVHVDEQGDLWYVGGTTMLEDLRDNEKPDRARDIAIVILATAVGLCSVAVFVSIFILLPLLLLG